MLRGDDAGVRSEKSNSQSMKIIKKLKLLINPII